ncbi:MAG TPA: PepSY-associated TM helix domain-containing protein, partial [Gammaproteobacteria bacterium]|nr:PepSY-associated TM helix domain-containing protein [Gammaproteobacteria bacterium]
AEAGALLAYDELFARAAAHGDWRTLTLALPAAGSARFTVDQGNGGQPQRRHTLTLDAATGEVRSWAPFSTQPPGQRLRIWIRFLHTGEALGLIGQTLAAVVSATSVLMVWTGLALAWRRLIVPLLRRRAARSAAP